MRAVSQAEKGEAKQNERERCLGANPSQMKYHSSQQPKTIKKSTDLISTQGPNPNQGISQEQVADEEALMTDTEEAKKPVNIISKYRKE